MKCKVNGKEFNLRCDLDAMEQIEDEFGGFRDLMEKLKSLKNLKKVFLIMANNGEDYEGTGIAYSERDLKHMGIACINDMMEAIKDAMEESMHSETINGEADDEKHDLFAEEFAREQKKT